VHPPRLVIVISFSLASVLPFLSLASADAAQYSQSLPGSFQQGGVPPPRPNNQTKVAVDQHSSPEETQESSNSQRTLAQTENAPADSLPELRRETTYVLIAIAVFFACVVITFGLTLLIMRRRLDEFQHRADRTFAKQLNAIQEQGATVKKFLERPERPQSGIDELSSRIRNIEDRLKRLDSAIDKVSEKITLHSSSSGHSLHRPLDAERESLERERAQLTRQRQEIEEADRRRRDAETVHRRVEEDLSRERSALEEQKVKLREDRLQVESETKRNSDSLRQAREIHEDATRRLSQAEALESKNREEVAAIHELDQRLRGWRAGFWPELFREGETLSEWRDKLEELGSLGKTTATLTCLAIGKYRALTSQEDSGELAKAVHEVSKYAYQVWTDMGLDQHQQADLAKKWSRALEKDLDGKFFIRVAEVGDPKDSSWMSYSSGNTPVQKIESWCVQNARRVAVQKANVS
jgi:DNA repair exonuclease SbcCD ATPase subunit